MTTTRSTSGTPRTPGTVDHSAEHDEIRTVARRFLEAEYPSTRLRELAGTVEGSDPADWRRIAELGWPAIALAEEYGGVGYMMAERCLLLEEMGRVLLPGPFLSSAVVAADVVALAASAGRRAALLPPIGDGSLLAAVVAAGDLYGASDVAGRVTASLAPGAPAAPGAGIPGGWHLSGAGGLVLDAAGAELLLVAARLADGSVGLFAAGLRGPGIAVEPVEILDATRRVARVSFSDAGAARIDAGVDTAAAISAALLRGTLSVAAEMAGGAQRCLDLTVAYLKDRHQFGKPIGSFQALKHRCADLAVGIDAARESVLLAAEVVDAGQGAGVRAVVAAAKAQAGDAYLCAANEMIQLHGGIGFTWEHDAHLFYKRALCSDQLFGTATRQRARLAEALGV